MLFRTSLTLAALAILASSAVSAQDQAKKYRFNEGNVVGDVVVVDRSENMSMDITATRSDQQVLGPFPYLHREREKYKETDQAGDAQGLTSVRRVYAIARKQETKQMGETEAPVKVFARQGKTVTISKKGARVTATAVKTGGPAKPVALPADEISELAESLRIGNLHFFPDREVSIGDEWTPQLQDFSKSFSGKIKADGKARLEGETTYKGHPCAQVAMTLDLTGTSAGAQIAIHFKGTAYYALDLQRPLDLKLTGPMTMKQTVTKGAMSATLEGEGTAELADTREYLKTAGKDVTAAP